MNQFNLHRITNIDAEQMTNPMKCAALFLGFIKGPNIKDWVKQWTNWTIDQFTMGRATTDEYYWSTIIHGFENAFRDTGAREHVEMHLNHLIMAQHEVDIFLAQFETMAHEAQHPLDTAPTLTLLASKLPFHMMNHIYKVNRPQTFVDWANAICQYHQDNTAVQNLRAMHEELRMRNATKQKGYTPQQLAKILGVKMPTPDANTMDTVQIDPVSGIRTKELRVVSAPQPHPLPLKTPRSNAQKAAASIATNKAISPETVQTKRTSPRHQTNLRCRRAKLKLKTAGQKPIWNQKPMTQTVSLSMPGQ
jgi:hypothetical protein